MSNQVRAASAGKRVFLLFSLLLVVFASHAAGLRQNRSLLQVSPAESKPSNDEFTGDTYMTTTVDEEDPSLKAEENSNESNNETAEASFLEVEDSYMPLTNDDDEPSFLQVAEAAKEPEKEPEKHTDEANDDEEDPDEDDGNTEDFFDRSVGSSLLEFEDSMELGTNNLKGSLDEKSLEAKNLNDNKLKAYLRKIGAIDRMKQAKVSTREAARAVGSKMKLIPRGIRKVKKRIIPDNPHYSSVPYDKPKKGPHGRRLADTMNEVDERREGRVPGAGGSNGSGIGHGSRLANTMRSVDERKRVRVTGDNNVAKLYDDTEKENSEAAEPEFDKYAEDRKKYLKENRFRDKNRRFTTTYDG